MDRDLSARQRRARWRPLIVRLVLGAALVALAGWSGYRYLRPSLDRTSVRIAAVERGPLEASVTAAGTVVPGIEQTIPSPVTAEIRAVHVSVGERVHAGQPIMQLDTRASELELAGLDEQVALKRAERRGRELELADRVRQAGSRRDLLAIDLESGEVRLGRFEQLAGSGAVSENDVLETRLDVRRTRVELGQVEAEIESLEARRQAEVERLELEISILEKQRAEQARRVAMSAVAAPFDGVVTDVVEEAGTVVAEDQPLAVVAAEGAYAVEASLSDFYAPRLELGQPVRVTSSSGEATGVLRRIVPVAGESRLRLFVELDDPGAPHLQSGMRVDAYVIMDEKSDALVLRRGPAVEGAGARELYVVDGERARRVPVRLGLSSTRHIEVVEGLEAGDEVVISDMSAYEYLSEIRIR